jgi:hypothetical protein
LKSLRRLRVGNFSVSEVNEDSEELDLMRFKVMEESPVVQDSSSSV